MMPVLKYFLFLGSQLHRAMELLLCHSLQRQQRNSASDSHSTGKTVNSQRSTVNDQIKRMIIFSALIPSLIYMTSCERVIEVDLNDAEKKYVIEAVVSDQPGSCRVYITKTKNFDENNSFPGISGARVTISDNNGTLQSVSETSPGVYEAPAFKGTSLQTYLLTVAVEGHVFTASSTMPAAVPFDSIYITERTFFDETNKFATVRYKDPPGQQNAYRFIQYVNGKKQETIFVRDDNFNDGNTVDRALIYFSEDDQEDQKLKSGDQVKVEMLSISYPVFKYWNSLTESATGENQGATPGNPLGNIQGGALGYFSAHTLQSKTITVP